MEERNARSQGRQPAQRLAPRLNPDEDRHLTPPGGRSDKPLTPRAEPGKAKRSGSQSLITPAVLLGGKPLIGKPGPLSVEDDEESENDEDQEDDDGEEDEDDEEDEEDETKPTTNAFERSEFQSSAHQKGLYTPHWCAQVTKEGLTTQRSLVARTVLGQLAYWFGNGKNNTCRARISRGGCRWIYKTAGALAKETWLTPRLVRDAIRDLTHLGIVIQCPDAQRGRLLRLDPVTIRARLVANEDY